MRIAALTILLCIAGHASAGATDVVVGFSPAGQAISAEKVVLDAIRESKKSIHLAAYSFTSKPIAQALVEAHKRGVEVRAVLDKSNAPRKKQRYSGAQFLANMGVPTRINSRYAIMHNKFMVIDGRAVQTGSFNYTNAAAHNNAENVVYLRDVLGIAERYEHEWQRLWQEAEPLGASN